MAGRQLQRLLTEQQPSALHEDSDEATSSEEEEEEALNRPAFNPFDLLTDGDSDKVRYNALKASRTRLKQHDQSAHAGKVAYSFPVCNNICPDF